MRYEQAAFEMAFGTKKQLPPSDLPEIAFSGRSNVGKSSLLNKLLNRKALARVSATPGKTQTINFFRVGDVRLCDLPGYGYAKVAGAERNRWSELMEHYFNSGRHIVLVVQLIDMRHPATALDLQMLEFLRQGAFRFVVALTKSDKIKPTQRAERMKALETELGFLDNIPLIPFSSQTGEGVEELKKWMEQAAEG